MLCAYTLNLTDFKYLLFTLCITRVFYVGILLVFTYKNINTCICEITFNLLILVRSGLDIEKLETASD